MKHLFIIISISACSFFIGCTSGPNPIVPCDSIYFEITIKDKITNVDLTGDSIVLPNIKYNKDSIRYLVESNIDTTLYLKPNITKSGFYNIYSFNYFLGNKVGLFKVILSLNQIEKDTLVVDVQSNNKHNFYFKDSLLSTNNSNCGFLKYNILK